MTQVKKQYMENQKEVSKLVRLPKEITTQLDDLKDSNLTSYPKVIAYLLAAYKG